MAKQTINIGSTANDGTGDTLRDAFDKANDNFTEIYDGYDEIVVSQGAAASAAFNDTGAPTAAELHALTGASVGAVVTYGKKRWRLEDDTTVTILDDGAVPLIDVRNGLARWRSKLAQIETAESGVANVVFLGDSNTTPSARFCGPLKQFFFDLYGDTGTGWQSFNAANQVPRGRSRLQTGTSIPVSPTPTTPPGSGNYIDLEREKSNPSLKAGAGLINDARWMGPGTTVSMFADGSGNTGEAATHMTIYYEGGTGDFTYNLNGAGAVTVENSTGSGLQSTEVAIVNTAAPSVVFTAVESPVMYGVNWENRSNYGVRVHKGGMSGYGPGNLDDLYDNPIHLELMSALDPDLIVMNLGSNLSGINTFTGYDTSPAGVAASLKQYIDAIRTEVLANGASTSLPSVLVLAPGDKGNDQGPGTAHPRRMTEYNEAIYQMCVSSGFAFASLINYHGPYAECIANGTYGDTVHYNDDIGPANRNLIAAALMPSFSLANLVGGSSDTNISTTNLTVSSNRTHTINSGITLAFAGPGTLSHTGPVTMGTSLLINQAPATANDFFAVQLAGADLLRARGFGGANSPYVQVGNTSAAASQYIVLASGASLSQYVASALVRLQTAVSQFTIETTSATGQIDLKANAITVLRADHPGSDTQAGMLVSVNRSGTITLDQVTIGAADSGGSGFRVLRVAN